MTLHFDLFYEYALFKIAPGRYLAGDFHSSQSNTLLTYLRDMYTGDESWRQMHRFHKRDPVKGLEAYVEQFFGYYVEGLPEIKISLDTNANDDEDVRAFKSTARAFIVSPFPLIVVGTGKASQPNVMLLGKDMECEGVHDFGIGPDDMRIAANTARVQRYVGIKAQQMLDYFFGLPKKNNIFEDLRLLASMPDPKTNLPKKQLPKLLFKSLEEVATGKETLSVSDKEIEELARTLSKVFHERIPEANAKGPLYAHLALQYSKVRVILNNLKSLQLPSLGPLVAIQASATITTSQNLSSEEQTKRAALETFILSDKPTHASSSSLKAVPNENDGLVSCANTFSPLLCIRFLRLLQKYNADNENPASAVDVDESQFDEKSVDGLNMETEEEDLNVEPWGNQANVFFE
ncbi:uncharacterized protein SAPINGB_P002489 [Magnusiomyces paraingens]|uniref:Uncharacterized protein n=1 Tax=Magnusiomyces paraingens TaxID=2606893 RepID=A0A5E8BEF7_9ASCO|nr:uncharacterized protein SAPINGB_P002489 [Saprochaete ingens]VVT49879.1 unnamed protein product [Saprochaete ingens]